MQLTPFGKLIILAVLLAAAFFSIRRFAPDLLEKVVVPERADLPEQGTSTEEVRNAAMPGGRPGCDDRPEVRFLHHAWNAQMGLVFAAGGKQATEGSLMCRSGVNLELHREEDAGDMQDALVAFATALERGDPDPDEGAPFVAISGDGAPAFLKGVNGRLRRLGPEYQAKVVGSAGYSRGEDKLMGLPGWKEDPASSRGGLVAGVLRGGGWNLVQKWLGDNAVCNNPDERTWDRNCLNWVRVLSPLDAAGLYLAGYCEIRPVVDRGRPLGERRKVCVDGVVTRTPGDVTVAQKKGGLVSIVSSGEDGSQIPNVIIGIDKWMRGHRGTVEGMLSAIFEGSAQVRVNGEVFHRASEISAEVYQEEGADTNYWLRYFNGVTERDRKGLNVELGGSSVNTLVDNLRLFGLTPGSPNLFGATYTALGNVVVEQYPDLVPDYPPVSEILDTSYIEGIAKRAAPPG